MRDALSVLFFPCTDAESEAQGPDTSDGASFDPSLHGSCSKSLGYAYGVKRL